MKSRSEGTTSSGRADPANRSVAQQVESVMPFILHLADAERLTVQVQSRLKPSENVELMRIRDDLARMGVPNVTTSSLVRTFILAGLRAYKAEREEAGA